MLDTTTLFTSLMVAELTGSALLLFFFLFWKHPDTESKWSALLWSLAFLLGGLGTFLIGMRGVLPDSLTLIAANFLILFGTGLRRSAVAVFFQARKRLWIAFAVGGMWLLLCQVPVFRNTLVYRVDYNQSMMILLVLWTVWIALRFNKENLYTPGIYGASSVIECCAHFGMMVHFNTHAYPSFLASFETYFLPFILLAILVSMVLSMITAVGMVIERSLLRFQQQAHQDELTSLPNRRAFFELAEVRRRLLSVDEGYVVIHFDLDNFKQINDRHGHAMGDAVLCLFASLCNEASSSDRIAGRLGGDEFAVFWTAASAEEAETFAKQLLRRFASGCSDTTDSRLQASASAGIALVQSSHTLKRALEVADRATYHAKRSGRARVEILRLGETGDVRTIGSQGFGRLNTETS